VFAYKVAVAIRGHGYTNIKIYNGGLKEWIAAGLPVETVDPLPAYDVGFITAKDLKLQVDLAEKSGCRRADDKPMFTLLDLRTERVAEGLETPLVIRTCCNTITGYLDDLMDERFRKQIPKDIPVYVVTETGNRDLYAVRYLSKFGYANVSGLQFGMRGWIKADYPMVMPVRQ